MTDTKDLVFSTIRSGNYILYNKAGNLSESNLEKLPNQSAAIYTVALAFADFDKDGRLEIVLGNHWLDSKYASSELEKVNHEMDRARNVVLIWRGNKWEVVPLPGHPGATLSLLASDFDTDNDVDLLVGNDFVWPNAVYLNTGNGAFKTPGKGDLFIPKSTRSTMSVDTGRYRQ